ncbi:N-formylglutamate deformylase [Mesobacterium sp. TK19101]|uniref:N-formylglutamate deformylase n=1 Tax=Mesobacterium hydrothermale TaxID=3111907 RepID=A0ABU6HIU6_9RHOB|nr:N-formylglutamate deformylase [Mesobacterium sp. TK19101]MEC3861745.1 N-formylglutamate deformylase [Mesobacterium sp. TK19101]
MTIEVSRGDLPVILALPHTGTDLPDEVRAALSPVGLALADTDWHIDRLYDGLLPGATVVRTGTHRYAVDVNRPPDGESLYPGQNTTALCPLTDFDGRPLYRDGHQPDAAEIARRRDAFHAPYHAALSLELQRLRSKHGAVLLYDCHSIRSRIPYLFDGTLPDFNIGTADGQSCAPDIEQAALRIAQGATGYRTVLNGRFKGGWTTRHYGRPADGIHAIQMELAQSAYLTDEAAPWAYDTPKATHLRRWLGDILAALTETILELPR